MPSESARSPCFPPNQLGKLEGTKETTELIAVRACYEHWRPVRQENSKETLCELCQAEIEVMSADWMESGSR
jgi:hypothetical protein